MKEKGTPAFKTRMKKKSGNLNKGKVVQIEEVGI